MRFRRRRVRVIQQHVDVVAALVGHGRALLAVVVEVPHRQGASSPPAATLTALWKVHAGALRASVGSTEASNGRLARVGVVGPTRARGKKGDNLRASQIIDILKAKGHPKAPTS
jgi:hypothetical protein